MNLPKQRMKIGLVIAVVPVVAFLVQRPADVQLRSEAGGCSPRAFGQALYSSEQPRADSVEIAGRSAEGSTLTVWKRDMVPVQLRITDYGEVGRATTTVYIVDSLNFLVWRTEVRYAGAIGGAGGTQAADSSTSVRFYCMGRWIGDSEIDTADAADLVVQARTR